MVETRASVLFVCLFGLLPIVTLPHPPFTIQQVLRELVCCFQSIIWMTYRSHFAPISEPDGAGEGGRQPRTPFNRVGCVNDATCCTSNTCAR